MLQLLCILTYRNVYSIYLMYSVHLFSHSSVTHSIMYHLVSKYVVVSYITWHSLESMLCLHESCIYRCEGTWFYFLFSLWIHFFLYNRRFFLCLRLSLLEVCSLYMRFFRVIMHCTVCEKCNECTQRNDGAKWSIYLQNFVYVNAHDMYEK